MTPVSEPSRAPLAVQALRRATACAHDEVDAIFSCVDLASVDGYRAFLSAQARAHLPVEAALDAAGVDGVILDWPQRRRADLLRTDLAELGAIPAEPLPAPTLADAAEIMGTAYVLEGSRLGGVLLRRTVGAGLPTRFLEAPAAPGAWRALLVRLDEVLADDSAIDRASAAARRVFTLFAEAGHTSLDLIHG